MSEAERFERVVEGLIASLGGAAVVDRIDTHAAVVLLAGDRVHKLKRPVAFSFLDFSTPAKRRAALEHELLLNRRTAPELYVGVVPVVEQDGGFAFGDAESPKDEALAVEHALAMRRFLDQNRLDRVAERAELKVELIARTVDSVCDFHDSLEPLRDFDQARAMSEVVRGNAHDLRASVPAMFDERSVEELVEATDEVFARDLPLLARRAQEGFVRHCHGDLHLSNIALVEGRPLAFDCIEFNDDFAKIDVLYDVAFLIMDLLSRGRQPAALLVLQSWLDRTEDDAALELLPLFLSLRAAVRAKIAAFSGERGAANRYLALAAAVLQRKQPRLVAVGGLSCTGKSTLARNLAPHLSPMPGAVRLRSDVIRKRMLGRPWYEQLPPEGYKPEVSHKVFARMEERAGAVLDAGFSAIADGVYALPSQRDAIEAVAGRRGLRFDGFWLTGDLKLCQFRAGQRCGDASDADASVIERQSQMDVGRIAWRRLSSEPGAQAVADEALRALKG